MIRFIRLAVLIVVAAILLLFAFANRQFVTVSFDPFSSADNAAFAATVPAVCGRDRVSDARRDRRRRGNLAVAGTPPARGAAAPRRGEQVAHGGRGHEGARASRPAAFVSDSHAGLLGGRRRREPRFSHARRRTQPSDARRLHCAASSSPRDRARGRAGGDSSPDARLDGERLERRPLSRRQNRQRLSRQFFARTARGHRPLRAAVRPQRRNARRDRRNATHPLANSRSFGAGGAPSRAVRRAAPARRGRRRARAISGARSRERAPGERDHRLESPPRGGATGRLLRSARQVCQRGRPRISKPQSPKPTSSPARLWRRRRWSRAVG